MAMKMFLNRQRAFPTALYRDEEIAPSSKRRILVSGTAEQLPFKILDETSKCFKKFNATGRNLLINLIPRVNSEILQPISRNALLHLRIT
jgi:hypothetical protein